MFRPLTFMLVACLGLSACANATRDLDEMPEAIGDFSLGFAAAVAPSPQKLLVSREATPEEWVAVVEEAYVQRFDRFEGGKRYNFGLKVEAYSLPPPIVPGKSAVQIAVTVWDDAAATKLNEEPKAIAVIKVFETRLASSREESMEALAAEAALATETWMREQQAAEGWFAPAAPVMDASGAEITSEPAKAVMENTEAALSGN
ncbi:hypothetical protein EDD52_1252 [Primorskyibacter sedentarius]|uniref:Lipoprotein n=1 Tax=Primorskyibacter sedentarius TaxID=745311 RepID=A0A4R3J256_9RHOB|nr:hypothetical protein [Primorskyibacter sedentarius]TCS58443.1 hypothetical protein EDD52_1252 [Primorskyibacter sedentarius]